MLAARLRPIWLEMSKCSKQQQVPRCGCNTPLWTSSELCIESVIIETEIFSNTEENSLFWGCGLRYIKNIYLPAYNVEVYVPTSICYTCVQYMRMSVYASMSQESNLAEWIKICKQTKVYTMAWISLNNKHTLNYLAINSFFIHYLLHISLLVYFIHQDVLSVHSCTCWQVCDLFI